MMSTYLPSFLTWFAKDIKIVMPSIALLLVFSANTSAQTYRIPADKNPQFNSFLNPNNNPDISPRFNSMLSPQFNTKLNPKFNSDINPVFNTTINPYFNPELNPLYNKELDPKYNPDLNPAFNLSGAVYNLQGEVGALLCIAWPNTVIVEFNTSLEFTGYWVTNRQGGYNFFDTSGDFKSVIMCANGKGGFNVFDEGNEWLGFAW